MDCPGPPRAEPRTRPPPAPRRAAPPQAGDLGASLARAQRDNATLRGRCLELQHSVALLGGDLRGRLALVQGSVLAEMREQLAARDAAIAASQQQLHAFAADLGRLSGALGAKLAAERGERERLGAEASQARLLCTARGRQVAELQQRVSELEAQAEQAQGARGRWVELRWGQRRAWAP
jgi:uncharacterized coiled-coil protein SlyX